MVSRLPYRKDLTGIRRKTLTAVKYSHTHTGHPHWECICDCGKTHIVRSDTFMSNLAAACSCSPPAPKCVHGESRSKLYHVWATMKNRCNNPNDQSFHYYGGRGIRVCDEWNSPTAYPAFKKWADESGYKSGLTIDRIDFNGNYEPDNCRWVTLTEQQLNRRTSSAYYQIEFEGETHTLAEWCRRKNVNYFGAYARFKKGKSIEEVLLLTKRK